MQAANAFRVSACLAALSVATAAGAQPDLTVLSLDQFRTDRISGESRHEILPAAIFDGAAFRPISEQGGLPESNARRAQLLRESPAVRILFRGRRIGTVSVSDIHPQTFHCSELVVGSGIFDQDQELPPSEITDAVRGSEAGRRFDYATQAYVALSGALDATLLEGDALVTAISDPAELERLAADVASIEPRPNLLPLGADETRAYRLDRYDAVVVVRKRRSAAMLRGPMGLEFMSPLMTDIVVVRAGTGDGERVVHPLFRSTRGTDAMGQGGPDDRFIDAFELAAGTAWLVFERRSYESNGLLIFRLDSEGAATLVLENGLYGC